ncbi:MAG TPA: C39 family peptidase [Chitinispirillaceae bacterium]|nr:C39 family peptidase [Chitinispirillaceae bacterium]
MRCYLIVVFTCILMHLSTSYSLELNIPSVNQENSEWCWAACSQMALEYYGVNKTQTQICEAVYLLSINQTLPLYNTTNNYGVNYILKTFGEAQIGQTYFTAGTISKEHIFQEINKKSPIILLMDLDSGLAPPGWCFSGNGRYPTAEPWCY